jgi:hypothetical protein
MYTPAGRSKVYQYVVRDQEVFFCKTKQIDVIADTKIPGVEKLKLITDELTPNYPYSGPLKNLYIGKDNQDTRIGYFETLEEAQIKCAPNKDCTGVTHETIKNKFTTRTGSLLPSNSKETSWVKTGITMTDSTWSITVKGRDWTISK